MGCGNAQTLLEGLRTLPSDARCRFAMAPSVLNYMKELRNHLPKERASEGKGGQSESTEKTPQLSSSGETITDRRELLEALHVAQGKLIAVDDRAFMSAQGARKRAPATITSRAPFLTDCSPATRRIAPNS